MSDEKLYRYIASIATFHLTLMKSFHPCLSNAKQEQMILATAKWNASIFDTVCGTNFNKGKTTKHANKFTLFLMKVLCFTIPAQYLFRRFKADNFDTVAIMLWNTVKIGSR